MLLRVEDQIIAFPRKGEWNWVKDYSADKATGPRLKYMPLVLWEIYVLIFTIFPRFPTYFQILLVYILTILVYYYKV